MMRWLSLCGRSRFASRSADSYMALDKVGDEKRDGQRPPHDGETIDTRDRRGEKATVACGGLLAQGNCKTDANPAQSTESTCKHEQSPECDRYDKTVKEECIENDSGFKDNDDDEDHRVDNGDGGARLPCELWSAILASIVAPHERFVLARVSRQWRDIIVGGDAQTGRKSVRMAAHACRIRLAEEAIASDNGPMLAWALASLKRPAVNNAVWRFWFSTVCRDSVECAKALHKHKGTWPFKCIDRCPCRDDPQWNPTPGAHRVLCNVATEGKCKGVTLMLEAVSARHTRIEALLVEWHLCHPKRWVALAFDGAIERGHTNTMQRLWDTYRPSIRLNDALEQAARLNQTRVMDWIHETVSKQTRSIYGLRRAAFDRDGADHALIEAARHGAVDSVVWLCEHQFIDKFDDALVAALTSDHCAAARAMMPYIRLFCIYLDAKDQDITRALKSANKGAEMKGDAKVVWDEILDAI